jgi:hypothetical protein
MRGCHKIYTFPYGTAKKAWVQKNINENKENDP